jgi:uncharacterized protein YozE (UPF0346 family)
MSDTTSMVKLRQLFSRVHGSASGVPVFKLFYASSSLVALLIALGLIASGCLTMLWICLGKPVEGTGLGSVLGTSLVAFSSIAATVCIAIRCCHVETYKNGKGWQRFFAYVKHFGTRLVATLIVITLSLSIFQSLTTVPASIFSRFGFNDPIQDWVAHLFDQTFQGLVLSKNHIDLAYFSSFLEVVVGFNLAVTIFDDLTEWQIKRVNNAFASFSSAAFNAARVAALESKNDKVLTETESTIIDVAAVKFEAIGVTFNQITNIATHSIKVSAFCVAITALACLFLIPFSAAASKSPAFVNVGGAIFLGVLFLSPLIVHTISIWSIGYRTKREVSNMFIAQHEDRSYTDIRGIGKSILKQIRKTQRDSHREESSRPLRNQKK